MSDREVDDPRAVVRREGFPLPRTRPRRRAHFQIQQAECLQIYLPNSSEDDGCNRSAVSVSANTWKGTAMRVRDIIKSKGTGVISVSEDANISDAAKIMRRLQIGALVVLTSGGKLKGIISEREIVVALAQCGKCALELNVRELTMLGGPVVSNAHSVADAMQIMTERKARHLPVVDNGAVVGLISIGDLVMARLNEEITGNVVSQENARWLRTAAA